MRSVGLVGGVLSTLSTLAAAHGNHHVDVIRRAESTTMTTPAFATGTAAPPATGNTTNSVLATAGSVGSTILVIASSDSIAESAYTGLQGYGIPYETLIVPSAGVTLPTLNSSTTVGNYGGIIILDSVAYDYNGTWSSAITDAQWTALYNYQTSFNVRMVRINEYPGPNFGTTAVGSCCDTGVEQLVSFSNTSDFPTARIKANVGITTSGLYHVAASITDTATTRAVAMFGTATGFETETVAAVINNFSGREQFVWFITWAPDWSQTSAFLQHAHIHWITRGVFLGKRKLHLSPQIDDVHLSTELYYPNGTEFRLRTGDLDAHVTWQTNINARMPSGSSFRLELGHNGNGDIIAATDNNGGEGVCVPDAAVDYDSPPDTALEFMKTPGTGEDRWGSEFTTYNWTKTCAALDDLASWFFTTANLNQYAHVSHTFSHLELNNATYHDAYREIQFNQAWLAQVGIDQATRFSPNGIIPPAITGLHNADAIQAWIENGITFVVGDNTRPVLRNTDNKYWPLISTVASNGYAGLTIVPRFSTTIYYNCDTPECTTNEWIATSAGSGNFSDLLALGKTDNTRYLLSLMSDPYMFHQANMRQTDAETLTIGDQTGQMSLVMAWTETMVQELIRLTDWPIISLTHDETAQYFLDRQARDACNPKLSYGYSTDGKSITSVTVTADSNTCSVPIPVTIPSGTVTASGGSNTADVVGNEPPIQWVTLAGSAVTLTLSSPITV